MALTGEPKEFEFNACGIDWKTVEAIKYHGGRVAFIHPTTNDLTVWGVNSTHMRNIPEVMPSRMWIWESDLISGDGKPVSVFGLFGDRIKVHPASSSAWTATDMDPIAGRPVYKYLEIIPADPADVRAGKFVRRWPRWATLSDARIIQFDHPDDLGTFVYKSGSPFKCTTYPSAAGFFAAHPEREITQKEAAEFLGAKSQLVAWTLATVPKTFMLLRRDGYDNFRLVTEWSERGLVPVSFGTVDWDDLLNNFQHSFDGVTWQPCGTAVGLR